LTLTGIDPPLLIQTDPPKFPIISLSEVQGDGMANRLI
jgi:hypothetical protein